MPKKKKVNAEDIISLYMDDALTSNATAKTVHAFAKKHHFDESDFYRYFSSFDALEKNIFSVFCTNTIALLLESEEYNIYDPKSKLLSFYYTFFEILTANRSYVYIKLKKNKNVLETLKLLSELKTDFTRYINKEIYTEPIDLKNETINKIQEKGILEAAWAQLLFTLQFWLEDSSEGFSKTDILIEKSIKASFDVLDLTPVKSVFDLAKFLWKEKMPTL